VAALKDPHDGADGGGDREQEPDDGIDRDK
jgi:hypothetical protein